MTLFRSFSTPFDSFGIILRYAFTLVTTGTEGVLSFRKTLFRSFPKPFGGFGKVGFHANAFVIHHGEMDLGVSITRLRLGFNLFKRSGFLGMQ